jgi:DNA-binding NarL/FixJ family response regulator
MVRVAVLDDQPAVRAGLQVILATEPDLQLVGFAADERALWRLLERTHPALVVLDLHHPGRDGLALCLLIERQPVPPAVLVYAAHTPAALIVAAAVADADAIVSKSSASAVLVEAIRSLARDPHPMSAISPRMKADAAERLDPADHAILAMRVAGESPVEIAATLRVPEPAIAKRITAIIAKLEPLGKAA